MVIHVLISMATLYNLQVLNFWATKPHSNKNTKCFQNDFLIRWYVTLQCLNNTKCVANIIKAKYWSKLLHFSLWELIYCHWVYVDMTLGVYMYIDMTWRQSVSKFKNANSSDMDGGPNNSASHSELSLANIFCYVESNGELVCN